MIITEVRTQVDLILNTYVQNSLCNPSGTSKKPDFPNSIVLNQADLRAPAFITPAASPENLCCTAS